MRTKVCAFACLVVAAAAGGAAWAFSGIPATDAGAAPVVQSAEPAGCCVTGDCCCPGQGSCCDLSKRASGDVAKSLKKNPAGCCSTGNCCCPGAGSCCATAETSATAKECCPAPATKSSCCSK